MSDKCFKTYEEQIQILKDRGMILNDDKQAIKVLKRANYYSLINGYKDLFVNNTSPHDVYKKGTTFSEIVGLYCFDRRLREIFLIELLRIEKVIRTTITHVFSRYYGYNHNTYLVLSSFNTNGEKNLFLTKKLICDLQDKIAKYSKKHKAISYYNSHYGYVPMWVLSTVLSFGDLNNFYARLKLPLKKEISNEYNLSVKEFESVMYILCSFRNKCAHGDRIYSYKKDCVRSHYIPEMKYHKLLAIPTNKKGPKYGREDILALLIVMKFFMKDKRYNFMIADVENQLIKLSSKLITININNVTEIMGLYKTWTNLKNI